MNDISSKLMKRNVVGGLILALVGLFFLAVSGANYVSYLGMKNDIQVEPCEGCEPFDKSMLDAVIGSGIFGAVLTSVGLFFFFYGMKQQISKPLA
jgi:hypothetical protein